MDTEPKNRAKYLDIIESLRIGHQSLDGSVPDRGCPVRRNSSGNSQSAG